MIKTIALAAAMATATCTLAFADDYRWSGIYAGFHAGWGSGDVNWVDNIGGWYTLSSGDTYSARGDGFLGGGQVGYLHHYANNFVSGIELSVSGLNAHTNAISPIFTLNDTLHTDVEFVAVATARLGYSFDRFLPYVEAGYAGGNVSIMNVDHQNCSPGCVFQSEKWHNGYVVGAGADFRVTKNIVAGLNYRYIDLGSSNHAGTTTISFIPYESYDASAEVHAATFRLNWLFNPN